MHIFLALLDVIEIACRQIISEEDYISVVNYIEIVNNLRVNSESENLDNDEQKIMMEAHPTWNVNYSPFIRPFNRIRFGIVFGSNDNKLLFEKMQSLQLLIDQKS
jgi:hypothetical protein